MTQLKLEVKSESKVSPKLVKQLGDWQELYPFFESAQWTKLKEALKLDLNRLTPYVDNWFKAFRVCPPDKLKVVWLGLSPYYTVDKYTQAPVADGLLFSTDTRNSVPPSLFKVYKGMEEDLYQGLNLNMDRTNNLEFLGEQGILLLNSALTTIFDDSKAHLGIWKPFIVYLLKHLSDNYTDLVFTGFGTVANDLLTDNVDCVKHNVIELEHPAVGAYEHRSWKHQDVFSRTNDYLTLKNKGTILWDKYLTELEVPF